MSLPDAVKVDQTIVNRVTALRHLFSVLHAILVPVTQLGIATCLLHIRGLSDDQLGHFVDEEVLTARQKPQKCSH